MTDINKIVEKQRKFFASGDTRTLAFRRKALARLKSAIRRNEKAWKAALKKDLNKSGFEAYMTEIGMTLSEITYVQKHLEQWMRVKFVPTPLSQFHARSFTIPEPYGVVLIMAPWNYPLMLSLEPLVDAIAAGNCVVLKPSAYAPETSALMRKIIGQTFPEHYITVIEGGRQENEMLLEQRFDYIFFTGSVAVGKTVMEKASRYLTPVTLELGGKSPCIVDESANLKLAAKRIIFGKLLNSGQTCVAPDYLIVHETIKARFLEMLQSQIYQMLGKEPLENPDYPRMINEKHYKRVMKLIKTEKIVTGGYGKEETLQIAPTILDHVTWDSPVMKEEIFGPVLPVITFKTEEELPEILGHFEKPLAVYTFTTKKTMENYVLKNLSFGGGCINDTIIHLATSAMGFGGVGGSGMGSYHGKNGFETFSHRKSIVKKYNWIDLPMRYHPYNKWKEKMIQMFLK